MKKTIRKTLYVIIVFGLIYVISLSAFNMLEKHPHPLVMDITAVESGNIDDFYWKINQVFVHAEVKECLKIYFSNSVPNFESYYIKMSKKEDWKKIRGDMISLLLPQGGIDFIVKAKNKLGGETKAFRYFITIRDKNAVVFPSRASVQLTDIPFRFEKYDTQGMEMLTEQTSAFINAEEKKWGKILAIRNWVHSLNTCSISNKDSNWNAVEILKDIREKKDFLMLCDEYAAVFVSACISVGFNARMVHLRASDGQGHYAAEVWSDQYQKWVYVDPLYNFSCCEDGSCYSALDLHNLHVRYSNYCGDETTAMLPEKNYLHFFQDFQIIMSNDFVSNPLNSVWDIISLQIRTLRWVDAHTPPLNRWKAAGEILLYHYLPSVGKKVLSPYIGIPFLVIMFLTFFFYRKAKQHKR